ncbi:MAG: CotH kinase family protein [Bacteroidia bacterium]|nr:CotH kinase family protein [Bacteroidia bacterium]
MRLLYTLFCASLICSISSTQAYAQLMINEFMQSNVETIMDDIKEFPDSWVELYNASEENVNLSEYSIGLEEDASKAYNLPMASLPPKAHILIYCDKEGKGTHTDFRLESGKNGAIYLFHNGEIEDQITKIAKMPAPDIAYGRKSDGADKWGYMLTTTPGKANEGGTTKTILGEPIFSIPGGIYDSKNFIVALSLPEDAPEGTEIRYTTDGTEPTKESALYEKEFNFNKSTVIRAKLFAEGAISIPSTTNSYLVLGRKVTLPVVSIAINDKYLNDDNIGIFTNNDGDKKKADWRRPVNFEYFPAATEEAALNQLSETRVSGGASRGAKFKSQLIYANKRFGTKRLEYEFFPNSKPGLTDFKSIMLRNAGNDFDYLYFRDAAMQINMASHCDLDWQAYQPVILFINGEYRGMLNIRERSNEDNIYSNYDGLEDIDMFENWYELKSGSWDNYDAFKALYNKKDVTYAELDKVMDISEFLNLMILNIFHNNLDFPGNNIVMWRPTAEGGKWRWVCKDTDFGLGLYGRDPNYKYFDWLDNPNYDPSNAWANRESDTKLYHAIIGTPEGQELLLNKFIVYMGDFLNASEINSLIDSLYNNIKFEYPYHRELINKWWPNHSEEYRNAKSWVTNRSSYMWSQLRDKFSLGAPKSVNINDNVKHINQFAFSYNGIPLTKGTFKGKDYIGRSIALKGEPKGEEYKIVGWEVYDGRESKVYKGATLTVDVTSDISYYYINAIVRGVEEEDLPAPEPEPEPTPEKVELYLAINGTKIPVENLLEGTQIVLHNLQGQLIEKYTLGKTPCQITVIDEGIYILTVNGKGRRIYIKSY